MPSIKKTIVWYGLKFLKVSLMGVMVPLAILAIPAESNDKAENNASSPSQEENQIKVKALPAVNANDAQLEKKIVDVLNKNPKIIVEALQKFSEIEQKAQQEKMQATLVSRQKEIGEDTYAAVLGKKDAAIKLVVFLDPNCPHCRHFEQAINRIRGNFPNVAILMRHWAIMGKDSEDIARGLWAIKLQGLDKYDAISKTIAASTEPYTYARLLAWANDQKLDVKKFEEDAKSQETRNVVAKTQALAQELGLQGTPTSILIDKNGIRLVMPTDEKSLEIILKESSQGNKPA